MKEIKKPQTDKPEAGKVYALTGVRDSKCILNGYSWKESEVKEEKENERTNTTIQRPVTSPNANN